MKTDKPIDQMTTTQDPALAAAEAALVKVGWTKGASGKWRNDQLKISNLSLTQAECYESMFRGQLRAELERHTK